MRRSFLEIGDLPQTFDIEIHLASVAVNSQTTQFVYDGDGNLVKKINPDGSKTIYVGGVYEVNKNAGGAVTKTTVYYPLANAMRVNRTWEYDRGKIIHFFCVKPIEIHNGGFHG